MLGGLSRWFRFRTGALAPSSPAPVVPRKAAWDKNGAGVAWRQLRRDIQRHNKAVLTVWPKPTEHHLGLTLVVAGAIDNTVHPGGAILAAVGMFLFFYARHVDPAPAAIVAWRTKHKIDKDRLLRLPAKRVPTRLRHCRYSYDMLAQETLFLL